MHVNPGSRCSSKGLAYNFLTRKATKSIKSIKMRCPVSQTSHSFIATINYTF